MDKYRRNDDMNDELGVYNQENYEGLTKLDNQGSPQQKLNVIGSRAKSNAVIVKTALLSPKEKQLLKYIVEKGYSIRHSAKLMKISQQMASKYWKQIKEKMK